MAVAHELHKTIDEVSFMSPGELAEWIAYFQLREERMEEASRKRKRQGK